MHIPWINIILFFIIFTESSLLPCGNISIPKTPMKFGIQTYISNDLDIQQQLPTIQRYLSHYANQECDLYDNIYIVWNY